MAERVNVQDLRWWQADASHVALFNVVRRIRNRTRQRRVMDFYHACLYDDSELLSLGPAAYSTAEYSPNTLCFNVIRQNIDTLTAKIAKSRPLPMAITNAGNYGQQRRAKKLSSFYDGQFEQSGVWRTSPLIARDALIFGTGVTYNYRIADKIKHDRIFPWEICVDPREAQYGCPPSVYVHRYIDRNQLIDLFPSKKSIIENSISREPDEDFETDWGYDDTNDMVLVRLGWHLRSGEGAKDGRYIMAVSEGALVESEWKYDYFPFTKLTYSRPLVGFFGDGMARQLTGIQFELNSIASRLQEAHHFSGGYVLIEGGSSVDTDHIDNDVRTILRYRGTKPDFVNNEPAHPSVYAYMDRLMLASSEMSGVSQLSSQSQKPKGLNSGKAIDTFNDIETERFLLFGRAFEDYHLDVAAQMTDLAEEIQDEFGSYQVRATRKTRGVTVLEDLSFEDVRLDKKSFTLRIYPTAFLSKVPSERLEQVEMMMSRQLITPDEAKMLLDFPDTERLQSLQQASYDVINSLMERFLEGDPFDPATYIYPEPIFDMNLCIKLAQQSQLLARLQGTPQANLDLLSRFILDAKYELSKLAPEPAEAGGMAPPEPQAPPLAA